METEQQAWSKLTPIKKHKTNPFKYRREIDLLLSKKFDNTYELITTSLPPIYFEKKYGNRNIEFYNLKCRKHDTTFSVGSYSLRNSTQFLKKCGGCAADHNKKIALLSFEDFNHKLRNSDSSYIKNYHFILDVPGVNKSKPKSLKLRCLYHNVVFLQDQKLLGKHHGCKQCRTLASKRKYSDEDLRIIVNKQLENQERGLSDLYSYQSYKRDKYNHYGIVFLCNGDGHKHPYPFKYNKVNIHSEMCPKCFPKRIRSRGERLIAKILNSNNISFEMNKTFKDLKFKQKLHVDFYIDKLNLWIEYDGSQHFKKQGFETDNKKHLIRLKRDLIKNEFCKNNKIHLLRIPYFLLKEKNAIDDLLLSTIQKIKENCNSILYISFDETIIEYYNALYKKHSA